MNIEHIENGNGGYFKAVIDGTDAGLMSYNHIGQGEFVIDHTAVASHFEGQGIGKKLVMSAVDYARANNLKIIPMCGFARKILSRDQTVSDVMAQYSMVP